MIDFDNSPAIFNPPSLGFEYDYDGAILIFDDLVWNDLLRDNTIKTSPIVSKNGSTYELFREYKYGDKKVLLAYPSTGASAASIDFELMIASGIRKFVAFGTCGVFDASIPQNSIIVPTFALRDEGTSYHYLPANESVQFSDLVVTNMVKCAEKRNFPVNAGGIWTTDAVYRETWNKIKMMQERGCIGVEMELSALMAVARFRKVEFAEFLIVDDLVSDQRLERPQHQRVSEEYLELALDILSDR